MPLLNIEANYSTREAREWLVGLLEDLLGRLDLDECIEKVNGEEMAAEIVAQIGYLPAVDVDGVFEGAIYGGLLD